MAKRGQTTIVRIAFVLLTVLAMKTTVALPNQCEEGWTYFREQSSNGARCYLPVKLPMDVTTARKFCGDRVSYLANLDRIDQFIYNDERQNTVTVPGFIFDNFEDFWSGMHIAENGRLMWHAYGPKFLKRRKYENLPWSWKTGQPTGDVNTCGLVTLGKREVINDAVVTTGGPDDVTRGPTFVFNGVISVEMVACRERRSFVCEKPVIRKDIFPTSFCPAGWVGHQMLPYCLRLVNETVNFETARKRCGELGGGYLSVVNDPGFNSFNQSIVQETYYYYQHRISGQRVWPNFWIQSVPVKSDTPTCPAAITSSDEFNVGGESCDNKLQYMCTRHVLTNTGDATYRRFPIKANTIEVSSPYLDQARLLAVPAWTSLPVSARFERRPADNEILFVQTPTTYLNSITKVYEYQGVTYTVLASRPSTQPLYVNVTLPPNFGVPARRRRSLVYDRTNNHISKRGIFPSDQEIQVDFDQLVRTCGYYSFGSYRIYPANYVETEPVLIRYSEKYLYIYVATVGIRNWVLQGEGGFPPQYITMRRLTKDDSYTLNLMEYLGGALSQIEGNGDIADYRGLVDDFSSSPGKMKLRLFVHPSSPRLLPNDFEQVLIPVLQQHLLRNLNRTLFETENVVVKSTVTCPTQSFYSKERNTTVTFPVTRVGELAYSWERCYKGAGAQASVKCEGGYDDGTSWGRISYNTGCQTFPELPESILTEELKNLSEIRITVDNVDTIFAVITNLTLPQLNLTEADIIYTAQIFYNYLLSAVKSTIPLGDIFDVINNVIQAAPYAISQAQELNNAANRMLRAVDDLTNNYLMTTQDTQTFVRDYVASAVRYQEGVNNLVIGLDLEKTGSKVITNQSLMSIGKPSDVNMEQTDIAIYLPRSLVEGAVTRLSFHIYSKTVLFSTPQGRYSVNSKVAAGRLERDGRPILYLGDDRVTVVFEVLQVSEYAVCGYWDYFANEDAGGWRTDGCLLTKSENESKITCECDHLTNFAVLIDLKADRISDTHKAILAIVTKVGLIISIIALALIILTFLVFKHLRKGRGQQVLVNLSVAMLCSAIIFLVGMDRAETKTGCKVVAVLLHYFILVSFAWMLVEGVLQYLRFVKVLGTYIPNFMKKSMIPAWGIPLIPVIIVLAIDHDLYYGGKGYCWLETKAMLYAFIIPVALVIFANLVVFILVLCNICRRRNKGMKSNQSERKLAFLHVQAGLSIFVILGLTWIFGFLAINEAQVAFHYIFAILNAFQGLFIFLLFTVREPQIRKAWRQLCCKKSEYKHTSGTGTDSNPRKMSADTSGTKSTGAKSFDESPVKFDNPQYQGN